MIRSTPVPRQRRRFAALAPLTLATAAVLVPFTGQAAYIGTLAFVEPSATVGPNDTIPVWVRFTLDPASDPLVINTDENGTPSFGIPVANYPQYFSEFNQETPTPDLVSVTATSLIRVYLNTWFGCGGVTFTSSCSGGPPYNFSFNVSGPDTINFLPAQDTTFTLLPGQSRDYLFGSFTPSAGPVAPGTYTFPSTGLTLNFNALGTGEVLVRDANGDPIPLLDEFGNPVYDQYGDSVFQTRTIGTGEVPVLDEFGNPIPLLDEFGNPVLDEFGNPVYETEPAVPLDLFADIDIGTTNGGQAFVRNVVPLPGAIWMFGAAVGAAGSLLRRRSR